MLRALIGSVVMAALLFTATVTTGCLGEMALFKKVQSWNGTLGDKWINSVVHFAFWIVPVYPVTILADVVVLNTIEFWAGSNPVSARVTIEQGEDEVLVRITDEDGSDYLIHGRRGEPTHVYRDGTRIGIGEPSGDGAWVFHDLAGQQTRVASPAELAQAFPRY